MPTLRCMERDMLCLPFVDVVELSYQVPRQLCTGLGLLADGSFEVAKFTIEFLVFFEALDRHLGGLERGEEGDDFGRSERDGLGGLGGLHGLSITFPGGTLHCSAVRIHQAIRIDPQEAGRFTGAQDHLHLDGVSDDRLPVTCMGDPPGVDLDHLGFVGLVELPA